MVCFDAVYITLFHCPFVSLFSLSCRLVLEEVTQRNMTNRFPKQLVNHVYFLHYILNCLVLLELRGHALSCYAIFCECFDMTDYNTYLVFSVHAYWLSLHFLYILILFINWMHCYLASQAVIFCMCSGNVCSKQSCFHMDRWGKDLSKA